MNFKIYLQKVTVFCVVICLLMAFGIQTPNKAKANTNDSHLNVNAKSAILIDANTGQILYEKNADKVLPPASMTKMMTEYLVMKALHSGKLTWNTKVSISDYVYKVSQNREYSNVPLRKDYQYTVKELYEAMAIYSANGATIALAEKIGGSEKNFVNLMNKTARQIGMEHAKYINSSGLENVDLGDDAPVGGPNDSNLLSPKDLAKLAYRIVTDYPEALKISSTPIKDFKAGVDQPINMVNWNYMLPGFGQNMNQYKYQGVDGLKTGHTDLAGYCFTGTVNQNGHRLINVVFGTKSDGARFIETKKLFDYGYQQFSMKTLVKKGTELKNAKTLPVLKGKQENVKIGLGKSLNLAVENGNEKDYKIQFHLDKSKLDKDGNLVAPVKKGEKVGYATVTHKDGSAYSYLFNQKSTEIPVVTTQAVEKSNWFVLMMQGIGHFFASIFHGIGSLFGKIF
nr:serine hydrolase [Terrilactibacillus tamarindi]